MLNIVERARRYVAKCPVAISGQGGDAATFHVAATLVRKFSLSESDAMILMREWNQGCLPPWSESELVHKVRSAAGAQHSRSRGWLLADGAAGMPVPRKTVFCPMVLKRVAAIVTVRDVFTAISAASPVPVDKQDCASVLRCIYGNNAGEKVLIFSDLKSQGQFLWEGDRCGVIRNSQLPAGPDGVWFLPQPVDGKCHPNPRLGGKMSRRSEESVTAWRYVVLESDEASVDDWLRCLVQMPLPISCICESGGRSIHALVRIEASSKGSWDVMVGKMKPVLVTLGADPGALSAVRLTRLPQAMRGNRLQRLLYLNPDPDKRPIADLWRSVA